MTTTQEIVARTGLTFRQVDYWTRQGYLRTVDSQVDGTGRPREFQSTELQIALRMRDLVECGFSPSAAHRLARGDRELMAKLDLTLAAIRVATG